jgi:EcsC protein family
VVYEFSKNPLTKYEKIQWSEIKEWQNETPSVISQALGTILEPVNWVMRIVMPEKAIRGLLDAASEAGRILTDKNDILRDGKVEKIIDLKYKSLQVSDELADEVHNWAIGIATTEGGITGAFGLPGTIVDIPTIITLALRTIHKIGICYGYECKTEEDKKFILGILAASGANSVEEKTAAIATLKAIHTTINKKTWKKMAQIAAEKPLSQEAAIITIRNLAKQLGINLSKRKALQVIPVIGAIVGGSSNGWYVKDVGWAARRAFQERWLVDNEKTIDL